MRVTKKYIEQIVNDAFKDYDCVVNDVTVTHYTKDQYENGACHLVVTFVDKFFMLYCFYTLKYLQGAVNEGYEIYVKIVNEKERVDFSKSEISYRLKPKENE